MKRSSTKKTPYYLLGIVIFFALWFALAILNSLINTSSAFVFPGPIETISKVIEMVKGAYIYRCIYDTVYRMILGFIIAFIAAFILGVISGNFEKVEYTLKPIITVFKSLPTACLVYLFLVLVGSKVTPLLIVILVSFPILYEAITAGIKSTPKQLIEAYKLDKTSFLRANLKVRVPLARPYIITGITSSFGLSLKIEIMAEIITGYTQMGLGSAILAAQRSDPTNMVPIFAYGLVVIVLMLIVDLLMNKINTKYSK